VRLFDTHAHIAYKELTSELEAVMEAALANGVEGLCLISAEPETMRQSAELYATLRKKYPQMTLAWSAGLHPHEAKLFSPVTASEIESALLGAQAVGETGLDYHYDFSDRAIQQENFRFHIQLAKKTKKPLVIHCREAAEDILKLLDEEAIREHRNPGVLHCFTEDQGTARKLLDRGFYISFSGIITFKNSAALRETAKIIPLDRILIETDSPFLAPIPKRGKRNEPAFVKHTFSVLADLLQADMEQLAEQLWKNSCTLFSRNAERS
jgi:TatD DNase family protein